MKIRDTLRAAIQNGAVCLLAYLAGFHLTQAIQGASSHIGAL
jgi:hypothetical protein